MVNNLGRGRKKIRARFARVPPPITNPGSVSVTCQRKVNESILFVILQLVLDHPGVYLREIQAHVEYLTGTRVSASTICKALHDQRFSRKRMQLVARQRDESLLASNPGSLSWGERRAWYTLSAHASTFP